MRTPSMTKPRRRLFAAGKIAPKARPCIYGHAGPWEYDAIHTAWIRRLTAEMGMMQTGARYGRCGGCGSHAAMPEAK